MSLSARLSQPAYDDLGADQGLAPVLLEPNPTLRDWQARRAELSSQWRKILGEPTVAAPAEPAEAYDAFDAPDCRVTMHRQATAPDSRQQIALLEPVAPPHTPRPAAIVPFYRPRLMAGVDPDTKETVAERPVVHFGRHLVQQGYVVACVEAFPYNTVPDPESDASFAWWHAAADKVLADNPHWTGMGKLVHDTRLATDLLLSQPNVDAERVVAIGHSLGGKMAFYAGCLDERVKAVIANDFGIGYDFTNWDAPWYLGEQVARLPVGHHHLLALLAPRAFLLIAGQTDKPESWQHLNAARPVYELYGRPHALGMFDHATGHSPNEVAMTIAYQWLAEQFDLPQTPYRL